MCFSEWLKKQKRIQEYSNKTLLVIWRGSSHSTDMALHKDLSYHLSFIDEETKAYKQKATSQVQIMHQ